MSDQTASADDAGNAGGAASQVLAGGGDGQGFDWAGALGDQHESYKPMLEAKGWKEPGDALKAYGELEKKLGDPDSLLRIPGDNASAEELAAFHKRLGVPDTPDGYQFTKPDDVEDYDDNIAAWLRATGHRLSLPAKALSGLHDAYFEEIIKPSLAQQGEARAAAKRQLEMEILENWPEAKQDAYLDGAKRGARFLGLSPEKLDGLLDHVSDFALVEAMRKLGDLAGEDALLGGGGGGGSTSQQAARRELEAFTNDREMQKAYTDRRHEKHEDATKRFNDLVATAYPFQA